jgi:hypothetical protein
MWDYLNDACRAGSRWMTGLDKGEWFLILIAALVLGFLLLRGNGSRANY